MGHVRLGSLPNTVPWRRVVGLLAEAADVSAVAGATTAAARQGFRLARSDEGLSYCVWLLTQTVLAARRSDFARALRDVEIQVGDGPGIFDIVAGFTEAVDAQLRATGGRTDIGEMAQLAGVEALSSLLGQRAASLFGTQGPEVQQAARELSTERGFALLAHDFFARFTRRFLAYHLGRELSNHVGGNGRFPDPGEHDAFLHDLDLHCRQTALIVRDFAGDWYSKHNFEGGITPQKARNFANYALKKLRAELERRGVADGE